MKKNNINFQMEEATNHILVDTCTCMRFCNWFGQFYIQIQTF